MPIGGLKEKLLAAHRGGIKTVLIPEQNVKDLAKFPNGSKLVNNLDQVGVYQLGNDGGDAMLLPTGSGCVVISVASAAGKQGS